MRLSILPAMVILAAGITPASADETTDRHDIAAARQFAEPIMATQCQLQRDDSGNPGGDNQVFRLTFRMKGQDQDSPDLRRTLVQLACSSGAYNFSSIWVMRNDDEGGWQVLNFAEPVADYDYADENFATLTAPPRVSGYVAVTRLTNSGYVADTKTITSNARWRGLGDAWSSGEWRFEEGSFVLKRYEIDPTFEPSDGSRPAPVASESYVLFADPGREK